MGYNECEFGHCTASFKLCFQLLKILRLIARLESYGILILFLWVWIVILQIVVDSVVLAALVYPLRKKKQERSGKYKQNTTLCVQTH